MNILVLGNGFDLAHGLPTSYINFLEFCEKVMPIYNGMDIQLYISYKSNFLSDWKINNEIKDFLEDAYKSRKKENNIIYTKYPELDELYSLIENNIWFYYFKKCDKHGKENWIDFENEISKVIKSITQVMEEFEISLYSEELNYMDGNSYPGIDSVYYNILNIMRKCKKGILYKFIYLEIKNYLLDDLNCLTRALEIYLTKVIGKIETGKVSSDIEFIAGPSTNVLNFNYTDTYFRKYSIYNDETKIDYIHGKADINNTIKTNNMVLGIDEYLSKKKRNSDTDFIAFKKYYQRIFKGTGCKYKDWLDIMYEDYKKRQIKLEKRVMETSGFFSKKQIKKQVKKEYLNEHNLYIFGHSLDVTDKDILRDLILNNILHTTIFYHSKEELGKKIANLVKVIGQDELIKRTGGNTKIIEFVQQNKM